jgi:indole-3-glycerol phosphate synthase
MTYAETGTILDAILARTASDLDARKRNAPISALEAVAAEQPPAIRLGERLKGPGVAVIAEIKRASPSRGVFPVTVDPAAVAAEYVAGGAAVISVLTDVPYFQGSLSDMESAASVAHGVDGGVPILRKDFVIDRYQIVEARARGADAVLLIVAALSDAALFELIGSAERWGMDALVEVHDENEMARAVAAGAKVIGINNRDLKTFTVDLAVTERLAPLAPEEAVIVAESGVLGAADVERLQRAGADAVLVGEGLITAPDRAEAVRALRLGRA